MLPFLGVKVTGAAFLGVRGTGAALYQFIGVRLYGEHFHIRCNLKCVLKQHHLLLDISYYFHVLICVIQSMYVAHKMGTITGWGVLNEGGSQPQNLQELQLPFQSHATCEASTAGRVSHNMFCAGYRCVVFFFI